jgi:hypothetical protein
MKITGNPSLKTLFIDDLDLQNTGAKSTAVFLPTGYVATGSPSAIVYLEGFSSPPIEQYLASSTFALREETNRSNPTDLVFIAPSLGPASEPGNLVTNGLDWFLDQVLARMGSNMPDAFPYGPATFSKVYLAAHSGGGRAMRNLAMQITSGMQQSTPVTPKYPVVEYWLFDALYAPDPFNPSDKTTGGQIAAKGSGDAVEEEWFEVVKTQSIKLVDYYATSGPTRRSLNLKYFVANPTVVNYSPPATALQGTATFVASTKTKVHAEVVKAYWKDAVDQRG